MPTDRAATVVEVMMAAYSSVAERSIAEHGCVDEKGSMLSALQALRHLALAPGYRGENPTMVIDWLDDCIEESRRDD